MYMEHGSCQLHDVMADFVTNMSDTFLPALVVILSFFALPILDFNISKWFSGLDFSATCAITLLKNIAT